MKKGKRMILSLALSLIFLAIINSVNASIAGPECEILEKPENTNVSCSTLFITIEDSVSEFRFLEAPDWTLAEIDYGQLTEQRKIIERNLGTGYSVIPFPTKSIESFPKYGVYLIRINNEYNIRVRYGGGLNIKALIEGITFYGGIVFLLSGLFLTKFTKHKQLAKAILVLGGALIVVFGITLFVSV